MKVKICGITNEEDADYSLKMGADIIGVILDLNVKRHGTVQLIERIKKMHPEAQVAGVYTYMPRSVGKEDYVQLHFNHSPEDIAYVKNVMGKRVISVIDLHCNHISEKITSYLNAGSDYILLEDRDGIIKRKPQLMGLNMERIGIAGKIDSRNLKQLVELNPDLIDVSSSLEERTGKKSFEKIDEFFCSLGERGAIR
ncbi:MAG: phosphoribosylanthranilate isomerase [Ferroplasma sp.]|uniref:phosphoribosylanthranilate isomerase n=1 Tax=Ferroplasma sp. TaxID=2591003 RepID=UPI002815E97F|nr:phosphoribosylanthranilate isomerase [Ferroplasma sp.]WMT51425.1 MAG: phosphoribosylanthranilate isomerase [Ferroplasma sp.]